MTLGCDVRTENGTTLGLGITASDSGLTDRDVGSKSKVRSYLVTTYGAYTGRQPWYIEGTLGFGVSKTKGTRLDMLGQEYGHTYRSKLGNATLASGYHMRLEKGFVLTPYGVVQGYSGLESPYTEFGGPLPIGYPRVRENSCQVGGGVKLAKGLPLEKGWVALPNANVSYRRELNPGGRVTRTTYAGQTLPLRSVKLGRDVFDIGLGLEMQSQSNVAISFTYNATLKKQYLAHTAMLKLSVKVH